jgi:hypothetical protein
MHMIDSVDSAHVRGWDRPVRSACARVLVALSVVALLAAVAPRAHGEGKGQPGSAISAAAVALFDEALRLMNAGRFAEACPKLEESEKLDPAVGTLLYLGNCYEQTNRTASAWGSYRAAAEAARSEGQSEREKTALERAAALETLFARIVVVVAPDARIAGLVVKRDGAVLGEGSWGVGVPVDPGSHLVEASAPGKKPFSRAVRVPATNATVTVSVPKLEDAGAGTSGPIQGGRALAGNSSAQGPGTPSGEGSSEAASSDPGTAQRIAGGVIGGTGLVGLVLGIVYGVRSSSLESDSEQYCQPPAFTICTQDGLDLLDDAHTSSLVSTVSFVVGGVLVAGGLVIILTAPSAPDAPAAAASAQPRVEITPLALRGGAGLAFRGAF